MLKYILLFYTSKIPITNLNNCPGTFILTVMSKDIFYCFVHAGKSVEICVSDDHIYICVRCSKDNYKYKINDKIFP